MSTTNSTKCCTKCGTERSLNDYPVAHRNLDGHRNECKPCVSAYNKEYKRANRERLAAQDRAWREANKEHLSKKKRRWYAENNDLTRARTQAYKKQHPEQVAEWNRRARERHWLKRQLDEVNRRAAKKAGEAPFDPTDDQETFWRMYEDQDGLCAYCEVPLFLMLHFDHMIPLSRGGTHDWVNLALTCPTCNLSKGNKTPEEFMAWLIRRT